MDFSLFSSNWQGLGLAAVEAQASGLFWLTSENVPSKIDITNNVKHKKLEETDERWADEIVIHINDRIDRMNANEKAQKSDFNIEKVSLKILSVYES